MKTKREPLIFTIGEVYYSTSHFFFVWYKKEYLIEVCDFAREVRSNYNSASILNFANRIQNKSMAFGISANEPFMALSKVYYDPDCEHHVMQILADQKTGWIPVPFGVIYKKLLQENEIKESK